MIVVSDTNVLSSLAAGDSLPALLRLFARSTLYISAIMARVNRLFYEWRGSLKVLLAA